MTLWCPYNPRKSKAHPVSLRWHESCEIHTRWMLWVARGCSVHRWLQGPCTQHCQFSFLMLVLLQVWAEKTDGAMTWHCRAVSFSLCRGQWSARSRGPGLAAKGSEGVGGIRTSRVGKGKGSHLELYWLCNTLILPSHSISGHPSK